MKRPVVRLIGRIRIDPALMRAFLLALCFLLGGVDGHVWAVSGADGETLGRYLRDYCVLYEDGPSVSLAGCALLYFGYVTLAFLLGFSSVGVVLIPALSAFFGFLSMYAVTCFSVAFGPRGILLALGAMGVRMLFTLPCFLILSAAAWPLATALAVFSFGGGKRAAPVVRGKGYFVLFGLCVLILTVGVCCERFLTPLLFRLAMAGAL